MHGSVVVVAVKSLSRYSFVIVSRVMLFVDDDGYNIMFIFFGSGLYVCSVCEVCLLCICYILAVYVVLVSFFLFPFIIIIIIILLFFKRPKDKGHTYWMEIEREGGREGGERGRGREGKREGERERENIVFT